MEQGLRIYTHPLYRGIEIHNHGTGQFDVVHASSGRVLDSFGACESPKSNQITEDFAQRRAQIYFERMLREDYAEVADDAQDVRDVVNNPGRDFADEQVINPDHLIDAWEKAQAMPPGPQKDARLAQVRAQASQFESEPEEVVRRLLA